jgi:4-hydroxy-tetrahydrodipicolinate synthase
MIFQESISAVYPDIIIGGRTMVERSCAAWSGVFPATLCPFLDDYTIDESNLQRYLAWVAGHEGVKGITVNGHTGEITSLRNEERARVTMLAVQCVSGHVNVISGVCAEGSLDAIDQAAAAKDAGAAAILLMPPHHWLRFGRTSRTAIGFIEDVAASVDMGIILHQYPLLDQGRIHAGGNAGNSQNSAGGQH